MEFGISTFVTDETPSPGDIGRLAEERGFTALFVAEHTHMPHDTVRDVDRKYYRSLDPFVTLTAGAATSVSARAGTRPRSRTTGRASTSASASCASGRRR